jgi:hypothetical protein
MEALWSRGPLSIREVQKAFPEANKIAIQTIRMNSPKSRNEKRPGFCPCETKDHMPAFGTKPRMPAVEGLCQGSLSRLPP